jgi:predicted nucleic acid-binding protein
MVEDETHHEACVRILEETDDGYTAVHSLCECYATLTGGRLGIQLSPADATALVRNDLFDRLSLISFSASEYMKLIESASPAVARGGAIYDLLSLACARKAKAERIYTLNRRHFAALAPDLSLRIEVP